MHGSTSDETAFELVTERAQGTGRRPRAGPSATVRPVGYTAIAVALGLVAGLAAGGRPANAAAATLRLWPVLAIGAAAQWVPELLDVPERAAFAAVVVSYLALAAFAVANLHLVGMSVVLVGLGLNIAVIFPNGGMPVRAEAVVRAGVVRADEVAALDYGSKRHLERDDDVLTVLGDIVPVAPLGEVVSFGDLILAAGVTDVVFRLLRPSRSPSRPDGPPRGAVPTAGPPAGSGRRRPDDVADPGGEDPRVLSAPGA